MSAAGAEGGGRRPDDRQTLSVSDSLLGLFTVLTVQSVDELKDSRSLAFKSLVKRVEEHDKKPAGEEGKEKRDE